MRVREDVYRDLHKAIRQLEGLLGTPGTLEIALRESARRDEIECDPGPEIKRLVDLYIHRELGPDVTLDDAVLEALLRKLYAGEPFNLLERHQASIELAR